MEDFRELRLKKLDFLGKFTHYDIEGVRIWARLNQSDSIAFYDECAHMGGSLKHKNGFICENHGWSYDEFGYNMHANSPNLRKVPILYENNNEIVFQVERKKHFKRTQLEKRLQISVLSHACILLEYDEQRILFDPWLKGAAYFGAWKLFPNCEVNPEKLNVDAIVITHPHPDHFHPETLGLMDKETPVYFPGFPSHLIQKGLTDLGWKDSRQCQWGEELQISKHVSLTFVRPRSFWEDSATFVRVHDPDTVFTWLNLVDAGSVLDEYSFPDLDLLSSAFDQGASGYPLTWSHLSGTSGHKILQDQKKQKVRNLPVKSEQLRAKAFLPFAGHWRLHLPEHSKYERLIPHTTFDELQASFKELAPEVNFLNLPPGYAYDFCAQVTSEILSPRIKHEEVAPESLPGTRMRITQDRCESFKKIMKKMSSFSEVFNSESVIFRVTVIDKDFTEDFRFGSEPDEPMLVEVEISERIFCLLAEGEANWDHVAIGYWGVWSRTSNRYPANFMRLLQAGYPEKYLSTESNKSLEISSLLSMTIADLIERNGREINNLFTRVGLPCGSCALTNSETLSASLRIHNIDLTANPWFLRELSAAYNYGQFSLTPTAFGDRL
jgi:CMP-N-acetylneuraminate monooxygenase